MTAPDASGFNPRTQLVPHIVDHYATVKPEAIYAEYPVSLVTYEDGYRPITFKAFANAVNGIAWWLVEKLGPGNGEILAYVGPNDLRYPALVLGAVKAGYRMFLTSPRNSVAAHNSLFKRLNCTKLVAPVPRPPPVTAILEAQTLDVLDVPSVEDLVNKDYPHFEFTKAYPEAAGETLAVIHTSGSTGVPKPIFWTHGTACKHMHMTALDPPEGFESQHQWLFGKRMFLVPPPFHAAGLAYSLFINIPVGTTIIFPASAGLPTAAALVEARKKTQIDVLLGVPSIIQELSQSPELLEYCSKHLERLVYCGGDLPQPIGDTVASKIPLMNLYGASEVGMINSIHSKTNRDPLKDWRYININPRMGAELRHVSDHEYELILVRNPEFEAHQLSFTVFPDRQEYHTSDLFVRHPDPNKPDLWRWSARADDVIVFLNGEKTNPVSMEQHIAASNPEVTAALVAGARRFQASLLIELGDKDLDPTERAAMMEKLWPSIEEANAVCPAHARVAKTHILFTKPDKPMLRAGKGTIQRAGTLALYGPELHALYADADTLSQADREASGPGRVDDAQLLSEYIRQSMIDITGWNQDQLTNAENFFHLGLDSLQAITATRTFRRGLDFPEFSPNLIYLHPSVAELTEAVLRIQHHQQASAEATKQAQLQQRAQLLQEFSAQIRSSGKVSPRASQSQTVILTGSTGNLGTYILDTLLKTPSVTHVHCLNRKDDAADVQRQKIEAYSLNLDLSRVSFWTADLARPELGLGSEVLETLRQTATLVIHNAWAVNFNLSLPSFKPNLAGVVNLINFSAQSTQSPHLFFISSISSTMGYRTDNGLTPEAVIQTTTPAPNGYADSKYLAELLLDQAARQGRVHASFARVGQIAGAVRSAGLWNRAEWFPSLVLSSLHVGALPDTFGPALDRIDWMPIDLLADVLVELALGDHRAADGSVNVYHPVNLHPRTWENIRPGVADALSKVSGKTVDTVPFRDWVQRVREDIETAGAGSQLTEGELQAVLAKNPAAKLLEFFEGIMSETGRENVLDTQVTAQLSDKLRGVEAVQPEWVQKWVGEWLN
ncbi:acetyl-CoA synthetase-like protein [Aspergillus sclerotiicarbonarius CBS 121057]|uniref:Acetyl-CoA synthetase-like protein n=1 Tax=Aspergillus sclerotiicarbonarius (strain CBS 121057 / IBT 28362) TaxID=1448318 RepID=A0A319ET19_ASPSB|nr:acetyl-CoA synthetase-like protein [Aspergillus sclerotiicarbonarius CBS 121057]